MRGSLSPEDEGDREDDGGFDEDDFDEGAGDTGLPGIADYVVGDGNSDDEGNNSHDEYGDLVGGIDDRSNLILLQVRVEPDEQVGHSPDDDLADGENGEESQDNGDDTEQDGNEYVEADFEDGLVAGQGILFHRDSIA